MHLQINGEPHTAEVNSTILDLLASLAIDPSRIAIEYNGLILRKESWSKTVLEDGDKLEIVHFVGGGC
ncbi:MAG: sulfur carrier protein ThiS [Bryobacterales bacterium]|nr:sulfur carrier protein ThiS [Bryobacterales bacterium]